MKGFSLKELFSTIKERSSLDIEDAIYRSIARVKKNIPGAIPRLQPWQLAEDTEIKHKYER